MVPGILSIADVVDTLVPGGLSGATDADVDAALDAAFTDGSPSQALVATLSEDAERRNDGWFASAFTAQVVYDRSSFADVAAEEAWLRGLQSDLRDGAIATDSIGVTIDGETTFGEAAQASAPFIFLAVALIVALVALVHRSYWSAVVVSAGLAATALAYYGTASLVGLKMGSLLLAFVVPIAMISFGVDFYIHGIGRVREVQVEDRQDDGMAYPVGMSAVFTAMLLALTSSVAAFLANVASGTEAIIQFGVGSSISLVWAYVVLGQIAPRVTVGLEAFVGDDPVKGPSRYLYALGAMAMAVVAGLTVAVSAIMPQVGALALVLFAAVMIGLPLLATRIRNRRAAGKGREFVEGYAGSAHGFTTAGSAVAFLARWRTITIPVVVGIGIIGLILGMRVESGFRIEDFLSSDTDFARSIERVTAAFPSSGEGSSFVFVEGDLANPANLAALDDMVRELDRSDAAFGRDTDGAMIVGLHAGDIVRMVMDSPARETIEANGPSLTDADGDGYPDSSAGVDAVLRHAAARGVMTHDGALAIAPGDVPSIVARTAHGYGTSVVIQVGSFTDGGVIGPVETALRQSADAYETATTGTRASVSGEVLTQYHSMESFTRSMLVSLPLALLLALVIVAIFLRSLKLAVLSMAPIVLVVIGIYAFMAVFGFTVNMVTATIAAIAVGVGIDFSTHFTARYDEELKASGDPLESVRRAGVGTGGALVLSALTSVLGFLVMAMAPTPIFSTFGILTAVMIALSLATALLVLPSLLVLLGGRAEAAPVAERGFADIDLAEESALA
jgi:predicted RND superfamily exporter protein